MTNTMPELFCYFCVIGVPHANCDATRYLEQANCEHVHCTYNGPAFTLECDDCGRRW